MPNGLKSWLTPEKLPLPENVLVLPRGEMPSHDGYVARCYDDGQLQFLGYYSKGSFDRSWGLILEHGIEKGAARRKKGSGGSEDFELYRDGKYERFDAFSDSSEPRPKSYEEWVRSWIKYITGK